MARAGSALALALAGAALAQEPGDANRLDMMRQLGITALRSGVDADPASPRAANTDEARANPFQTLPDPLRFADGRAVTAAEWSRRRAEIAATYAHEVYGEVPAGVPTIRWQVEATDRALVGERPVIVRRVVGSLDDAALPSVEVRARMTVVLPADARGPVPVLVMLWPDAFPPSPKLDQLIAAGWGYARLDPTSVQADSDAGLRRGVIGLTNRGGPRSPEQWGALRAWAWAASQARIWLATQPGVNARRIGIEGVSRYGKAALVAMAFDEHFAIGLIGSSGKGGTTLLRRDFGEGVGNLATGESHWLAGAFLRYDTKGAGPPGLDAGDLPVDANELIALAAPRPLFISYGVPAAGDAAWLDQRGSWMGAVDASRVYRLLGREGVATGDWRTVPMPPVGQLVGGTLAWRQHDGGHTDAPNMATFLAWADGVLAKGRAR